MTEKPRAEKPPAFVVVDKRKFTSEGEIREGYTPEHTETAAAPPPEPPKVVTMPAPATAPADEAIAKADDLGEEDLGATLEPTGTDKRIDWAEPADEGDLADDDAGLDEPRTAAETAQLDAAYQDSNRKLDTLLEQANPGMQPPGTVGFETVVQSFYLSAMMAMGADAQPGEAPRIDILGARQPIDMLAILEEKTRGNLTPKELQLLQSATFELRMMFLELMNAISKQAQKGPAAPPGAGLR